jgi:hypothetical protein
LLDRYPNLSLDNSATRWQAREISARRDAAREFVIRNADRIIFGSDQVSGDDRGFDFLASRFWVHRKLWETAYSGPVADLRPGSAGGRAAAVAGIGAARRRAAEDVSRQRGEVLVADRGELRGVGVDGIGRPLGE